MPVIREPAVAGQFYAGTPGGLKSSLRECFLHALGPGSLPEVDEDGPGVIDAIVSPHAGYMYSGPCAANAYAALAADGIPETAVILGPSHYVAGRRAAVSLEDGWRTPLGVVRVDRDLGAALLEASPLLEEDERAHALEHSLEVQLPFLQFVYGERCPMICPICVCWYPFGNVDEVAEDARAIGGVIAKVAGRRRVVVIASTDMSHQVSHERAQRMDRMAIDAILALEPERLLRTVVQRGITMCGPVPVAIALSYCLARGPHEASLLRYCTSGDMTGDRGSVVGYASLTVRRTGGEAT